MQRGEGDGEEYAQMPKIYEKYPLEPPELPPRDYTTDEDNLNGKNWSVSNTCSFDIFDRELEWQSYKYSMIFLRVSRPWATESHSTVTLLFDFGVCNLLAVIQWKSFSVFFKAKCHLHIFKF